MHVMRDTQGHDDTGAIKVGVAFSGNAYVSIQLRDADDQPGRLLIMEPNKCNHGITICRECANSWEIDYLVEYFRTAGGRRLHEHIEADVAAASVPNDGDGVADTSEPLPE
ncbi:hypothetical protein [Nocardia sp. NPDC059195]|uniref:hypothetical protein n=1 Tax=Nocardia sp. NPDC059195 TaxID=3346765 RepID=UPI003679B51B